MDKLDIPFCQRQAFWFTYKNSVRKGIKQQRFIAHNALKEIFREVKILLLLLQHTIIWGSTLLKIFDNELC